MTANSVEERTVSNAAPSFADQDDVEDDTDADNLLTTQNVEALRTVDENTASGTNIGKPVSASDGDGRRAGLHPEWQCAISPMRPHPVARPTLFGISPSTGQLTAKAALNFEGTNPTDNLYSK